MEQDIDQFVLCAVVHFQQVLVVFVVFDCYIQDLQITSITLMYHKTNPNL